MPQSVNSSAKFWDCWKLGDEELAVLRRFKSLKKEIVV